MKRNWTRAQQKHRHGGYDRFVSEWSIVFAQAEMIDEYSDQGGANWESLCVGWAIAKGMTLQQSFDFYQEMLDKEMG